MTISQGGTGSGTSGPAVRNIYNAIYGVDAKGGIDKDSALLPDPEKELPEIDRHGNIAASHDDKFKKRAERAVAGGPANGATG
jgi:penicillin-binding protein 2